MSVMKYTILYSLLITSSAHYSLEAQDAIMQDNNEDLILVFDDRVEEIYPLEDSDTICLMPEIQNYGDDLEVDQATIKQASDTLLDDAVIEQNEINVPAEASCDIDCTDTSTENNTDTSTENNDEQVFYQDKDPIITMINQEQLEDILNDQHDLVDITDIAPDCIDIMTIPMDDMMITMNHNGILLSPEFITSQPSLSDEQDKSVMTLHDDDDDIIPVPHDLINSVKKANKLKKKLEKKERKAKASFFKKSKK